MSEIILNSRVMLKIGDDPIIWLMHEVICENRDYKLKYFRSEFEDGSGCAIDFRDRGSFLIYENSICIGDL